MTLMFSYRLISLIFKTSTNSYGKFSLLLFFDCRLSTIINDTGIENNLEIFYTLLHN